MNHEEIQISYLFDKYYYKIDAEQYHAWIVNLLILLSQQFKRAKFNRDNFILFDKSLIIVSLCIWCIEHGKAQVICISRFHKTTCTKVKYSTEKTIKR